MALGLHIRKDPANRPVGVDEKRRAFGDADHRPGDTERARHLMGTRIANQRHLQFTLLRPTLVRLRTIDAGADHLHPETLEFLQQAVELNGLSRSAACPRLGVEPEHRRFARSSKRIPNSIV